MSPLEEARAYLATPGPRSDVLLPAPLLVKLVWEARRYLRALTEACESGQRDPMTGLWRVDDMLALVADEPSAELLRRALPLLERLGDYTAWDASRTGNGPLDPDRPDSLGQRCDLIGDIKRRLGA